MAPIRRGAKTPPARLVAHRLRRPHSDDERVLHAALDPRPDAGEAWRRWLRDGDRGPGAAPLRRLGPLVWWNLGGTGAEVGGAEMLRSAYSESWGRWQQLVGWAEEALEAFAAAGVAVALLKGLPMALLHYARPALRPMADIDLLVPPADREVALSVLAHLGYAPLRRPPASSFDVTHGLGHLRPDGAGIDLHWHALVECCWPEADSDLWRAMDRCRVGRAEAAVPPATDLLFHTCAHGVRWSPAAHLLWVCDAVTILRRQGRSIDWERLQRLAAARRLSLRLAAALAYVGSEFGAPVPAEVVDALAIRGATLRERLELRLRQRPPALVAGMVLHWLVHRRRVECGAARGAASFVSHLQSAWGLAHAWQVPGRAVGKAWSRRSFLARPGSRR